MNKEKAARIREELKAAGMTRYGLTKMATRELPRVIHDDEHIGGVIYGKVGGASSAMLVATDKRVIYIDRRAMFTATDELTYDVVSGIKVTSSGPVTSVLLHTRVNEYSLHYVNPKCAQIFTSYIEKKRLEGGSYNEVTGRHSSKSQEPSGFVNILDKASIDFLRSNDLAVLSTVDRNGNVHGSAVYYLVDKDNQVFVLTKSGTNKAKDVYAHNQVALTIFNEKSAQTLQIQGLAEFETSKRTKDLVIAQIEKPRQYNNEFHMPPVVKIQAGEYVIIRISPTEAKFTDYAKNS